MQITHGMSRETQYQKFDYQTSVYDGCLTGIIEDKDLGEYMECKSKQETYQDENLSIDATRSCAYQTMQEYR